MLSILLAISLFSVSSDTIEIKSTQNISYRLFAKDSALYFQYNADKNWSAPKIIDENVSEYTMTVTGGDYIHLVWVKQGRVFYKVSLFPLTYKDTVQWDCNIAISTVDPQTEPALNISISVNRDYLYVTWQTPIEDNPLQVEKWRRARWLSNTPFDWETPQNISPNITTYDIPHNLNGRDPIQMKQVCFLQAGQNTESNGNTVCCDSDHDGWNEVIFRTGGTSTYIRWEIWEYRPMNRYELVFADTGASPYPPGITTGNFRPHDVGDIDGDGLTDLVGPNVDDVQPDTDYNVVSTQESPSYLHFPSILSWWNRYSNNYLGDGSAPFYITNDLDNDIYKEIVFLGPGVGITHIFENSGNNQNILVWNRYQVGAWSFVFNDFDLDGYKEFATANLGSSGIVSVYENIGNNQYENIYQDTVHLPNGSDVFSGNDLDGDSKQEIFVCFARLSGGTWNSYLYMWEATGDNTYQRTLVDQIGGGDWLGKRSMCGDIDGDGIEELVWSIGGRVMVYKATDNNQFQRVWDWYNNHGGTLPTAIVNIYDMNNNGYKEIVVGGGGKTSFFEVEAVRLLSPNGGEIFQDSSQQLITWQTFNPPRCDSISLYYSINNGNNYSMITHGLFGNDTSYLWTVPNTNSDSCKVKIIAYGPGWQYDESDGLFSITTTGIKEIASLPLAMTLGLRVFPNPAKSVVRVRYSISPPSPIPSPVKGEDMQRISLQLFDISGGLVKTMVDEKKNPGIYSASLNTKTLSAGVYFITLTTNEKRMIERVVVIK